MLHEMGISTSINEEKLLEAVDFIAPHISRPIESKQYSLFAQR